MRHRLRNPNHRNLWGLLAATVLFVGFVQRAWAGAEGRTGAKPAGGATVGGSPPAADIVQRFESSYRGVRTLKAVFTQESSAWGRVRTESGIVYLQRGGKMRWEYQKPEPKLFLSDGKNVLLYVPAEKQLTRTPLKASDDVRVPLDLLLSHLSLRRAFSRVELAADEAPLDPGDYVLRAYPKRGYEQDYRDVLVELTPSFDIRRLMITYPDETSMKFIFERIARNASVPESLFEFTPPAGTEVIQQ